MTNATGEFGTSERYSINDRTIGEHSLGLIRQESFEEIRIVSHRRFPALLFQIGQFAQQLLIDCEVICDGRFLVSQFLPFAVVLDPDGRNETG